MHDVQLNHFESKGETNLVSSEEVKALLVSKAMHFVFFLYFYVFIIHEKILMYRNFSV